MKVIFKFIKNNYKYGVFYYKRFINDFELKE